MIVIYKDKTYPSLDSLLRELGLYEHRHAIQRRIRLDKTEGALERAISKPLNRGNSVTYKGKEYPTLKACVEENDYQNLGYDVIKSRRKRKWDLERAFREPLEKPKYTPLQVVVLGKPYKTLIEAVREIGIPKGLTMSVIDNRLRGGMSLDEAFTKELADYTCEYNNNTYKSENDLVTKLGLQSKAFSTLKHKFKGNIDLAVINCPKTTVPYTGGK